MSFMAGYLLGRSQGRSAKLQRLKVFSDEKKTYLPEEGFDGFEAVEVDITASKDIMDKIAGDQKLGELQLTDRYRVEARIGNHIPQRIYVWYNTSGEIPYVKRRDEYVSLFTVLYRDDIPVAAQAYTHKLKRSYDLESGSAVEHIYTALDISRRVGDRKWSFEYMHDNDTGFHAKEQELEIPLMPWITAYPYYTVLSADELTLLADDFYRKVAAGK